MGVNIYLKSFDRNEKTIKTHLESLNIYDGNDNEIDNFKDNEQVITNLEIIECLLSNNIFKNFYDINIYLTPNELLFYSLAYTPISGFGKNEESIICFDPKAILIAIEKLIQICENWDDCSDIKINTEKNLNNLYLLKSFTEKSIIDNSLITLNIG